MLKGVQRHAAEEPREHAFLGPLVGYEFYLPGENPGAIDQEADVKPETALAEFDEFEEGVFSSNGPIEVEECDLAAHRFIFLKTGSGMQRITSMIQRQNHLT